MKDNGMSGNDFAGIAAVITAFFGGLATLWTAMRERRPRPTPKEVAEAAAELLREQGYEGPERRRTTRPTPHRRRTDDGKA